MSVTPSNSGKSLVDAATRVVSPETLHPEEWSAQQVVRWLGSISSSISKLHSAAFLENDIAGEVLIRLDADALKDLGLSSVGHRLAVLKGVYELKLKWSIEFDEDDWKPTQQEGNKSTLSSIPAIAMARALQERDERVRALELELARLEDWLVRWSVDPNKTDILPPYFPPSKVYCYVPDGMLPTEAEHVPPSAFSGPVTATSSIGLDNGYDDAIRSRKPSTTITPSSSTFSAHRSGSLMDMSPTSSNATPSATPTSAQPPLTSASIQESPLLHRMISPRAGTSTLPNTSSNTAPAMTPSPVYRINKDNSGGPSSPLLSTLTESSKDRSTSSSVDAPYKSFRVTLDDPCHKVLPAALKKYKINDDWRLYALFICYGSTERCLSYDEKPLLLFQKLKEAKQSPVFMLRHIRDVKSPIAIASAKAEARKTADENKAVTAAKVDSLSSYMNGVKVSGGKGESAEAIDGRKEEIYIDSLPNQPKMSGPASQLANSYTGVDTYAVSIYPYVSERDDEFDVSVGDTFVVKSKAKGWWIVQRDSKASGQADVIGLVKNTDGSYKNGGEIQSGWVPAGCLLETKQPLSTIVSSPHQRVQSPHTPEDGTFINQQQRTPKSPSMSTFEEDSNTPKPSSSLASTMATAPIPPSLITSTSTPGILLMDYHSPEENFHLKKDTRLRVFKRYNHWSYCVDVGSGYSRAWLPSWYIGKVGTRSNAVKHGASASIDTSGHSITAPSIAPSTTSNTSTSTSTTTATTTSRGGVFSGIDLL